MEISPNFSGIRRRYVLYARACLLWWHITRLLKSLLQSLNFDKTSSILSAHSWSKCPILNSNLKWNLLENFNTSSSSHLTKIWQPQVSAPQKKSAKGIEGLFEFVDHVLDNAPKGISFDTMKPKPVKNCIWFLNHSSVLCILRKVCRSSCNFSQKMSKQICFSILTTQKYLKL